MCVGGVQSWSLGRASYDPQAHLSAPGWLQEEVVVAGLRAPWVLVSYFPQLLPARLEPPTHQDSKTQAGPASLSSASGGRWHDQGSRGSFPGHTHPPTSRLSPKAPL